MIEIRDTDGKVIYRSETASTTEDAVREAIANDISLKNADIPSVLSFTWNGKIEGKIEVSAHKTRVSLLKRKIMEGLLEKYPGAKDELDIDNFLYKDLKKQKDNWKPDLPEFLTHMLNMKIEIIRSKRIRKEEYEKELIEAVIYHVARSFYEVSGFDPDEIDNFEKRLIASIDSVINIL